MISAWTLLTLIATVCVAGPLYGQPAARQNIAQGQPVISSGPTWGGLSVATLTDGDPNTFTHPRAATGNKGYFFEVDLGRTRSLERIVLRGRADGCCPERLSNYRVEVYADQEGDPGALTWSTVMRADNSFPPSAGSDTLTSNLDPAGAFSGRFVRVVNNSGAAYNPQVAEIEVYGGIPPTIKSFAADEDTLAPGGSTTLRWVLDGAIGASLAPSIGSIAPTNGTRLVTPSTTTTYILTATNEGGMVTASISIGVGVLLAPPVITEFLAANNGDVKDGDGDSSDWIELQNPNAFGLDLSGYYLTDDPKVPQLWKFPTARIPANGFLVVFASGKNRLDPGKELHTNFKLSSNGGYLAMVDRDGQSLLQRFPATYPSPKSFPIQFQGISFGQGSNGSAGFMRPPTPGINNGQAYAGIVESPTIETGRGFYEAPITVSLSATTPDSIVRFTTNRSEPTLANGSTYTTPLIINSTTILRVAAFKTLWAPSPVGTHTFIFPDKVIASSVMSTAITRNTAYSNSIRPGLLDVPSISLAGSATINGTTETLASVEWIDPKGSKGFQANCGARLYGGAFTDFAKKNFRLYFRPEYGASKVSYPIFEGHDQNLPAIQEFDQLELRGGSHDMSQRGFYMSNLFTDETLRDMGHLNPHGRFVHLYLNGIYWGLYHLRERWGAAMHRRYLGGVRENYESINGNWNVGGWPDPGVPYDGDGSTWTRIKALRGNYGAIKAWLDVPQYVDYMLMWMFGGSEDEYRCVGPTTPGSGFKFCLNDADGWFCGPWYCAADNRTSRGAPGRSAGDGPGSIFSMLFKEGNADYRTLLADRIHRALFLEGVLTPGRNKARLLRECGEINRAFIAEAARWNYLTPSSWAGRRDYVLTNWFPRRTAEVLSQWRNAGFYPAINAPVLNQQGGSVPLGFSARFLSQTRGSVYFTLDGSDPRLPGGALSLSAKNYTPGSPLEIARNTIVKSRAKDGALWSALNESFFQVGNTPVSPGDLVVSELHFASPNAFAGGADFVELLNIGSQGLNLRGTRVSEGVQFSFPDFYDTLLAPGQRLVLVNDLYRFYSKRPDTTTPAGTYTGTLASAGERITLFGPDNQTLTSFAYDSIEPWPGSGLEKPFSIVLAHPQLGVGNPKAWRLDTAPDGSPGTSDSSLFSGVATDDADRDGLPAFAEYALGTRDDDPDSGPLPIAFGVDEQGRFSVSFTRNLRADDILLSVEASLDLVHWFPATLIGTRRNSLETSTETWGLDATRGSAAFLKITITRF